MIDPTPFLEAGLSKREANYHAHTVDKIVEFVWKHAQSAPRAQYLWGNGEADTLAEWYDLFPQAIRTRLNRANYSTSREIASAVRYKLEVIGH